MVVRSDPPGADVWLYELVEEGPILVERNEAFVAASRDKKP